MFDFMKKKASTSFEISNSEEQEQRNQDALEIGAGYVATQSANESIRQAAQLYAKPETYTGNRLLYDSGQAKVSAKKELFKSGNEVIDPYTGDRLVLTIKEAKMLYGTEWTRHLAESDHINPLEKVYEETKGNVWNTTEDIKMAANSKDNIRVVSRKYNNLKRSRTTQEFVENEDYLQANGLELTQQGKNNALQDSVLAEKSINQQLKTSALNNMAKTGLEAGVKGAQNAGVTVATMSGINNLVAVIKGEKSGSEALLDTAKDGGKGAISGFAMSGGLTVVSHSLSNSSSAFIQGLVKSNVPGKVITAVIATGDTLKRYGDGEITTQECIIELGDKGLNMATMGYSMAAGQVLIPIPIVGGAIGALVGSALTSSYYHNLINTLQTREMENRERKRIIEECREAAEQTKAFRMELESYLENYFNEFKACFDDVLGSMRFAYQMQDADGIITSANEITRKLGGKVYYETVEEFKQFLDEETVDTF